MPYVLGSAAGRQRPALRGRGQGYNERANTRLNCRSGPAKPDYERHGAEAHVAFTCFSNSMRDKKTAPSDRTINEVAGVEPHVGGRLPSRNHRRVRSSVK